MWCPGTGVTSVVSTGTALIESTGSAPIVLPVVLADALGIGLLALIARRLQLNRDEKDLLERAKEALRGMGMWR